MESIRTSTNDGERTTHKIWSYTHTALEGTRWAYITVLCTTRILISTTNHNIRTTQINKQSAHGNRRRINTTQRISRVCNCGWRRNNPTNMLQTTIRQGPIAVSIRNMCFPSSNNILVTLIVNYYDEKLKREDKITRNKIQVCTDSLSMIKKLNEIVLQISNSTTDNSIRLWMCWDVLSALRRALKYFIRHQKISWVKSYQDDKEYDKIEIPLDT